MYRTRTTIILLIIMQALFAQKRGPLPIVPDVDASLSLSQGYVEVSFGSLYYEMLGQGDTVILIHNHPFTREMWDAQFEELAHNYRVVRYDLRGYGASTAQVEYIQFTHADDLACLMHALDIKKGHLIGFDMGGNIVADMIAAYPERVSSGVMINGHLTKTKGPTEPMDTEELLRRDEEISLVSGIEPEVLQSQYMDELLQRTGNPPDTVCDKLKEMIKVWDVWQYFHKEARITGGIDTYNILKETPSNIPVLIIETGSESSETKNILSHCFTSGQHKVIPNCGYYPHMEQPQLLNNILSDFLQK